MTAFEQQDCRHENSSPSPGSTARSAFAAFRFPSDVIVLAVRWYLRFGLSYRDVEELLTERGVEVDHVTIYVKVTGRWRYVYRAVDRSGQVVDVLVRRRVAPFGCLEPVAADGGTGKEQEGKRQRPQPSRGRWWELLV